MPTDVDHYWPLAAFILLVVAILILLGRAWRAGTIAKLIERTPIIAVADLNLGGARRTLASPYADEDVVAIEGRLVALGQSLKAPLSESRCVSYGVRVIYYDSEDVDGMEQQESVPFALEDRTARIKVGRWACRWAQSDLVTVHHNNT